MTPEQAVGAVDRFLLAQEHERIADSRLSQAVEESRVASNFTLKCKQELIDALVTPPSEAKTITGPRVSATDAIRYANDDRNMA